MSREQIVIERWSPDLEVYGKRPAPVHPPFTQDLFSDKAIKASSVWPGRKHNVRLLDLDNDAFFYMDALPGQAIYKPRVLILDNGLAFRDAGAGKYLVVETPETILEKQAVRHALEDKLAELKEIEPDKLTEDDKRNIAGTQDALDKLNGTQDAQGFLETFPNLYGSKAEGVIWGLALPIPIDLIHKEKLRQDGAITLRVLRAETLPEQGDSHDLIFKFSNGNTQYALVFGRNNSVQWWHYRNMKVKKRKKLEDTLAELEDNGRLTVEDRETIRANEKAIDAIYEAAKAQGRSKGEIDPQEKANVESLKTINRELKESKRGLSPEDEKKRAELLKEIFYDRANVNLQEDTKSLFERVFDVTVRFLRKGQVQIQLDKQPAWTWTNGAIAKLRGYNTMLPKNCQILIHSDGGAFGFCVGRPDYKKSGLLYTAFVEPGFEVDGEELRFDFDADFVETEYDFPNNKFTAWGPFDTRVEATLKTIVPASGVGDYKKPPIYQVQIELFSDDDGVYTPEVHLCHLRILASAPPARAAAVWKGLTEKNPRIPNPVKDLASEDAENKSPHYTAFIDNKANEQDRAGLPLDLTGREVVLNVLETSSGLSYPLIQYGIIKRSEMNMVAKLTKGVGNVLGINKGTRGQSVLHLVGLEALLDKPIQYPFHGNGMYPNDYLRDLCQNAGLRPQEFAGIPEGNMGLPRIKPSPPGQAPDVKPEATARFWAFMQEIVEKFCKGYKLVASGAGVTLEPEVYRDRPTMQYSTQVEPWSPFYIYDGFRVYEDWDEYATEITVSGAVNPQTGKRFTDKVKLPEATNPDFDGKSLLYVGPARPMVAPPDDMLQSQTACTLYARRLKQRYCLPPWYIHMKVPYHPQLRIGDIIRVDGLRVVVQNITRGNLKAGKGKVPAMDVTGRFMDDLPLKLEIQP